MTTQASQHWVVPVTGLTCASCVNRLERALNKKDQVAAVQVNLALETIDIELSPDAKSSDLVEWVTKVGFGIEQKSEMMELENVSCASCVNKIERQLLRLNGVTSARVNLATSQVSVDWVDGIISLSNIKRSLSKLNYPVIESTEDDSEEHSTGSSSFYPVLIGFILSLPMVIAMIGDLFKLNWMLPSTIQFLLATPVQFWLGLRFYKGAYSALRHGSANMDVLVAMGTSAAYGYSVYLWLIMGSDHLYFEASAIVITLVMFGKWLEGRAKNITSDAIRQLMKLQPSKAQVWHGEELVATSVDELIISDEIQIQPGETVPADGIVIEGETYLNESMLTGESNPVNKGIKDIVLAGTQNIDGSIRVKIHRSPDEFRLKQIVDLVEKAQMNKPPVQYMVDRISAVFVPAVILIAVITLGLQWWVNDFEFALMAAISVLVIACPCALGLATPTAIIAASGVGARNGILIRDIEQLEKLAGATSLVFDKTGTLTKGIPEVVNTFYWTQENIDPMIKAVQLRSQHPLAEAVVNWLDSVNPAANVEQFTNVTGKGVSAKVEGKTILIGNEALLKTQDIKPTKDQLDLAINHSSIMWVALDGAIVARFELLDTVRDEASSVIQWMNKKKFDLWMLSGDQQSTATEIGNSIGINQVIGNLLPDHKLQSIEQLKKKGGNIVMIGDGINDAPALAAADVSIAMGSGTDVAMNTAGITLMRPSLSLVIGAYQLANKTVNKIRQNLFWAFIYNVIGIPLAAMGLLSPVVAGAAMAFSSVSVVTSSILLLKWNPGFKYSEASQHED